MTQEISFINPPVVIEEKGEVASVGSIGAKENSVKITYINGIGNTDYDCHITATSISVFHGYHKVYFVSDSTQGFFTDLVVSADLMFSSADNEAVIKNEAVVKLTNLWMRLLLNSSEETEIIHYAHSRGGLVTRQSFELLPPELRSRVNIFCLGSPAIFPGSDVSAAVTVMNTKDWVPLTNPQRLLSYLSWSQASEKDRIVPSKETYGEHGILEMSYRNVLLERGESFVNRYVVRRPEITRFPGEIFVV